MFILKKGHQPGVYVPLRALFLVIVSVIICVHSVSLAGVYAAHATDLFTGLCCT